MKSDEGKRPMCRSCAMPLENPEDCGTGGDGCRVRDYCRHCYRDGRFTDPGITIPRMIDRCASILARKGIMPEAQAQSLMATVIPKLKRWQKDGGHDG